MSDVNYPKKNPLTGTVVIEPPAAPRAPNPVPTPMVPVHGARPLASHPLERTIRIEDVATHAPPLPPVSLAEEDEPPPMTQAVPFRLNGSHIPFSRAAAPVPESERSSQPPSRTPWSEVTEDVPAAAHALSGTLVVEPEAAALLDISYASNARAETGNAPAAPPPAEPVPLPPLPPSDPWGLELRAIEPTPPVAPVAPPVAPPAPKIRERQEARTGLYGRFFKGKG